MLIRDRFRFKVTICQILSIIFAFIITGVALANLTVNHSQLFYQQGIYASHPSIVQHQGGELWIKFGTNSIRSHYGGAAGGIYRSQWMYSPDDGGTWFIEGRDNGYKKPSPEYGALQLMDETYIRINFYANEVVDKITAEGLVKKGVLLKKKWNENSFSVSYRVFLNIKYKGREWESRQLELPSLALIQSYFPGIVLEKDTILIPAFGKQKPMDAAMRTMVLRSEDCGKSWQLITIAYDGFHNFSETDIIQVGDGRVIAMIRCDSNKDGQEGQEGEGYLWQSSSSDMGLTWDTPRRTPIWGYPAHLLLLKDGRLLCTYGYRRPPYGIRACLSYDQGKTWEVKKEIILRNDALSLGKKAEPGDLGYPSTVQLLNGKLFTVYYIDLGDGITHIAGTHWSIE